MDIKELTQHMHNFVRSKGFYESGTPREQNPRNLAISLVLESSEVLEHFQWGPESKDPEALALELADVCLYLLQLASVSGIDLEEAVMRKLSLNQTRTWENSQ